MGEAIYSAAAGRNGEDRMDWLKPRAGMLSRALGVVGVLSIALGCDAANGSGPDGNRIRIVDPDGRLRDHAGAIDSLTRAALASVMTRLEVTGVTITLLPDPSSAIAGWGIGGFTPDAATVIIYLDPGFPDLGRLLPSRLPPLVAHELHHAVRHRRPGYGATLLEAMVSEGLADRFAIELLGAPPPPWSMALTAEEADRLLELARPEFDARGYDHPRWFFGTSATVPRWTGYTLGFRMVTSYQAAHPGATAAALVTASASEFRPR